jgi:UDP-N-acetylglucosamine transferase subunit ALG13
VIFVTVGNATQGFRRLLDTVDRLAGSGALSGETVLIQSGHNPEFRSFHCKCEPFLPMEEFLLTLREASVVVCHAGATLFQVIQAGKVPVVVPRRKMHGEIIDDHQFELTQALASQGRVIPAYEPDELPAAIAEARQRKPAPLDATSTDMHRLVARAIKELMDV